MLYVELTLLQVENEDNGRNESEFVLIDGGSMVTYLYQGKGPIGPFGVGVGPFQDNNRSLITEIDD